jgi:hypothetical protein
MPYLKAFLVVLIFSSSTCYAEEPLKNEIQASTMAVGKQFTLKEGTPLELELNEEVCAEDSDGGENVKLILVKPVLANDGKTILIKGRSSAKGLVSHAERAKRGGDPGRVAINARSIHAVDGSSVFLSGFLKSVGKEPSLMKVMWWGPYAKGQNPCLPAGGIIQASVDQDTVITVPNSNP